MAKRRAKKLPKTKRCPGCGKRKKLTEFWRNRSKRDGRQDYCGPCATSTVKAIRHRALSEDPVGEWARKLSASAASRSKRKNLPCTIDKHDIIELYHEQRGLCAITGVEMEMAYGVGRCDRHMSLDRINNDRGYEPGNIRLVCDRVNMMRGNLSDYELAYWCQAILSYATTDMDSVSECAAPIEPFGDIDIHSDF